MAKELFASYELPESLKTPEYKEVEDWYNNEYLPVTQGLDIPITDQSNEESLTISKDYEKVTPTVKQTEPTIQSQSPSRSSSEIVQYFMNKGLTEVQARGIYGNIMQESAGKTSIVSRDGHNSYGLAQWTGSRKDRLFNMYGNKPTKQEQLDFLWWELNNTHKDALTALKRTTTVSEATKVFMDKFEKPHKNYANLPQRVKYAQGPLKAQYGGIMQLFNQLNRK